MEDDLELEKARLLSLASDFGFDEEAATQCLDNLIRLYGEISQLQALVPSPLLPFQTLTFLSG